MADPLLVASVSGPLDATVTVPGSKSITNRALVCAALARGTSVLTGALAADDTEAMTGVLATLGIAADHDPARSTITVRGGAGRVAATSTCIDTRQSGTTSRFAVPMLALGSGTYQVDADPQMRKRPMDATFAALQALGLIIEASEAPGHLPALVTAGDGGGGSVRVAGDASSQFLSGLLLVGPCLRDGLELIIEGTLVSRPYVELTVSVMEAFGARVERFGDDRFVVDGGGYQEREFAIEPDASAASYPLAAAAICGGRVTVSGLGSSSQQGDAGFADLLGQMGAAVTRTAHSTTVEAVAGTLSGGEFDLTHMSDTAQTLAVVAPFAAEPVRIDGIGFIRRKEIDRIAAVATELGRCGVDVTVHEEGWVIAPGPIAPTTFETYDDHRMAMSFALLGLAADGIRIAGPACVNKTFPRYWDMLDTLRGSNPGR